MTNMRVHWSLTEFLFSFLSVILHDPRVQKARVTIERAEKSATFRASKQKSRREGNIKSVNREQEKRCGSDRIRDALWSSFSLWLQNRLLRYLGTLGGASLLGNQEVLDVHAEAAEQRSELEDELRKIPEPEGYSASTRSALRQITM